MDWEDIIKNKQIADTKTGLTTDLRENPLNPKDDCNKKLRRASEYLQNLVPQIKVKLKQEMIAINREDPPRYPERFWQKIKDHNPQLYMEEGRGLGTLESHQHSDTYYITITCPQSRGKFSLSISAKYVPIPEEHACHVIEMFNDSRSTDLNGYNDYDMNDNTGGGTGGILPRTKRYRGNSAGYRNWTTYVEYNNRRNDYLPEVDISLGSSIGYFWAHEQWEQIHEHTERFKEAINLESIHRQLESMLR